MTYFFSEATDFYRGNRPDELLGEFGSPLFVYSGDIFRKRCREMAGMVSYDNFQVTYSMKANSNLALLRIARGEGLHADAMSPGEIYVLEKAGYTPGEIFYISNNVSDEEMNFAIERGISISVDSLSQLERFGKLNPGGEVSVRFNPGVGAGHHKKVVTAGKKTKFGINLDKAEKVKELLKKYKLDLKGINQHIGSLFMDGSSYLKGVKSVLKTASLFPGLDFVDFGGGFGIPYKKQEGQERLELESFGREFSEILEDWTEEYGKRIMFRSEPGRYISAESGILLGTVYAKKSNYDRLFAGTDLGFNVLIRPAMYESHHDIEVYREGTLVKDTEYETIDVVGNICESGDIMAHERKLPHIEEGDVLGVMDAGAYGYSMSSNYNNRLRPAEVMIKPDGSTVLIRQRDTLEDLVRNF